ncbi:hypothetical protein EMCRGX_G029016 [Ephydatia muelleri]
MTTTGDQPLKTTGDQPLKTTGDQPLKTTGDQPLKTTGDQPLKTTGDQPLKTTGDQPLKTTGDQPLKTTGDQPLKTTGDQPLKTTGDQPLKTTGDQPLKITGDQPLKTTGDQPLKITGDQPLKTTGDQPLKTTGDQPLKTTGDQPLKTTGDQPLKTTGDQPLKTTGDQPLKTTGDQPLKTTGDQPLKTTGDQPLKTTGDQPLKTTGDQPLKTTGDQPLKTTGDQPLKTTGDQPLKTTGDQPMKTTGDQPLKTTGDQPMKTTGDQPLKTTGDQPLKTTGDQPLKTTGDQPLKTTGDQLDLVSEADRNMWWEHFFGEHFQENARFSIEVDTTGKGMRKHCLRSEWIMWFFRTMLENGVSGVSIQLGQTTHSYSQNNLQQLECRGAVMETDHTQPHQAKVSVTGNMVIEFTPEEKPRIIMWYFQIQSHVEYISRSEARQLQEQGGVAADFTIMGLIPAICKLLASAESMDSSFSDVTSLHHPTSTSTGMMCSQWQRSTHMEPVLEGNGLCPIPLSPTSQTGLSSTVGSTLSPPPCMGKPKMVRTSSSSHKKQRTSPVSKRSHYILVAPDAQPFTDDMVHGIDERMITRVDSKKARRSLSSSSESKEALTPLSISTQPQGQLGPAVWPNGCLDQPPVTDHNGR